MERGTNGNIFVAAQPAWAIKNRSTGLSLSWGTKNIQVGRGGVGEGNVLPTPAGSYYRVSGDCNRCPDAEGKPLQP